jgi:hypothetical protein
MIEIKDAIQKSLHALQEIPLIQGKSSVELEEVEMEGDGDSTYWIVTFSFADPNADVEMSGVGPNLAAVLRNKRSYKSVRVLASDGSVRGIKSIHV